VQPVNGTRTSEQCRIVAVDTRKIASDVEMYGEKHENQKHADEQASNCPAQQTVNSRHASGLRKKID